MKRLTIIRGLELFFIVGAMLWSAHPHAQNATAKALPGDSVYQLAAMMTDQNGHQFKLAERRGRPMLVSMFYNSCEFVCPMLIDTIRTTQQSLTPEERDRLSMMLMTFDPTRDTVKVLKSISEKRDLDAAQWTLALTGAANVRKIAAALDIQYRLLGNGEYNHTTVLVLLDGEGRIVGRTQKIGAVDPAFLALIRKTVKAGKL